jgi:hypothetical protein
VIETETELALEIQTSIEILQNSEIEVLIP